MPIDGRGPDQAFNKNVAAKELRRGFIGRWIFVCFGPHDRPNIMAHNDGNWGITKVRACKRGRGGGESLALAMGSIH